jgi:hypothetical protein
MEKEIDFNEIDDYIKNNKTNYNKLIINNIPNDFNINPNKFNELSNNIIDKGNLILNYNKKLEESEIKNIKMNLIFSGLINITINNNIITTTKKNFNNNKININNFNPNSTQESNKDIELLIDPFNNNNNENKNYLVNAKPCEGCTCGRANNNNNKIDLRTFKGCGKCHLGDGIRCKNCPFRGFPAFNVEDKIKVIDEFNMKKNNIESENNNIKIDPINNTIKLNI